MSDLITVDPSQLAWGLAIVLAVVGWIAATVWLEHRGDDQ